MRALACSAVALSLLVALPALADDYYVDATGGDDLNGGTSWVDAWQTLTHAFGAVPAPPVGRTHVIHVAPGVHDAALGEVFPLVPPADVSVVGAGPSVTRVDAGGAVVSVFDAAPHDADLARLGIHGGQSGVAATVPDGDEVLVRLTDVDIQGASAAGVGVTVGKLIGWYGDAVMELRSVRVRGCGAGVDLFVWGNYPYDWSRGVLWAEDCTFSNNATHGLRVLRGFKDELEVDLVRCRVEANAENGVEFRGNDGCCGDMWLRDCLLAGNGVAGFEGSSSTGDGAFLQRCTVVDNALGVLSDALGITLEASLLADNGDDLRASHAQASFCLIEDGDFAGSDDNFSAPPGFIDAPAGDWRLRYDSAAVDAGPPQAPGERDLLGRPRGLDGDLDTLAAVDVGAFELAPLEVRPGLVQVRPGEPVRFGLFGPAGGSSRILWQRSERVDPPTPTPLGLLWLDRRWLQPAGVATTAPGPAGSFAFSVPADPGLVGTTLAFQALTWTGHGGPPRALTNPLELMVVP